MENKEKTTTIKPVSKPKDLFIERTSFKGNDGKNYWSYLLKGTVRGREIKVDFAPKDKGGYEPLDIVFDVSPKAKLVMTEEEMKNDNGRTTKYTTYKVVSVDEDGVIYECGIKPSRDSDKALLKMLMNALGISIN